MSEHEELLGPDIQDLLQAELDAPAPPSEAKSRVRQRVGDTLGVPAPPSAEAAAAPAAAGGVGVWAALVCGALGIVAVAVSSEEAPPHPMPTSERPLTRTVKAPVTPEHPIVTPLPVRPTPSLGAVSEAIETHPRAAVPARPQAPSPVAEPAAIEDVASPDSALVAEKPSTAPSESSSKDDLRGEQRLLDKARRVLSGAPRHALRLVRRHKARYGQGLLREERDALWVQALVQAGKLTRAKRLARIFLKRYPRSRLRPNVEQALGK